MQGHGVVCLVSRFGQGGRGGDVGSCELQAASCFERGSCGLRRRDEVEAVRDTEAQRMR